MEQGIYNLAVDMLKLDITRIQGEIHKMYKGARPFRKEKVTPETQIAKYLNMTPADRGEMRNALGNPAIDAYEAEMNKLMEKYGGNYL